MYHLLQSIVFKEWLYCGKWVMLSCIKLVMQWLKYLWFSSLESKFCYQATQLWNANLWWAIVEFKWVFIFYYHTWFYFVFIVCLGVNTNGFVVEHRNVQNLHAKTYYAIFSSLIQIKLSQQDSNIWLIVVSFCHWHHHEGHWGQHLPNVLPWPTTSSRCPATTTSSNWASTTLFWILRSCRVVWLLFLFLKDISILCHNRTTNYITMPLEQRHCHGNQLDQPNTFAAILLLFSKKMSSIHANALTT